MVVCTDVATPAKSRRGMVAVVTEGVTPNDHVMAVVVAMQTYLDLRSRHAKRGNEVIGEGIPLVVSLDFPSWWRT